MQETGYKRKEIIVMEKEVRQMNTFQVVRTLGGLVLLVLLVLTACEGGSLPGPAAEQMVQPPPTQQTPTLTVVATAETTEESQTPPTTVAATTSATVSAIRVVSKAPLSFDNILTATETKPSEVLIRGWTQEEGLILRVFTPPNTEAIWAISPDISQAEQLTDWKSSTVQSNETLVAIAELKAINPRINLTAISPDGQWVVGGIIDEPVLLVKQVGRDQPPTALLSETEWGWFAQVLAWSPDSKRLAYAVGPGLYEIRISDPDGSNTNIIKLWGTLPSPIIWSPDARFLAFVAPKEPQQPSDVYVVGTDGAHLTNITDDEVWISGPIAWSPDGGKIAYGDGSQVWLVEIAVE